MGLLCLTLWPEPAHAQSPELLEPYKRSWQLYAQGRYQEAIPFAKTAVRLSEREFGPDHRNTAGVVRHLALLYDVQGNYAAAAPAAPAADKTDGGEGDE